MGRIVLVAAAMMAGVASGASSQPVPSTNYTSVEAEANKPLQLGAYGQARKDCSTSKLPVSARGGSTDVGHAYGAADRTQDGQDSELSRPQDFGPCGVLSGASQGDRC